MQKNDSPPSASKNARNKTFSPQGSLDLHDIKVCPQALSENARNKIFAPRVLLKMKFCSPQDSLLLSELLTPCQTDSPQLCPRFFRGLQTSLTPTLYYRYLGYASDMISVENFTHPRILAEKFKNENSHKILLSPQDLLNASTSAMDWNQIQFSPTIGYKISYPQDNYTLGV